MEDEENPKELLSYFGTKGQHLKDLEIPGIDVLWDRTKKAYESVRTKKYAPNPPRSLKLRDLLLGDKETLEVYIPVAHREFRDLISKLLGHKRDSIKIDGLDLMIHAHTKPVRANFEISTPGSFQRGRAFLKVFDPARLFGLEIYNLLAGIGKDYHFITDDKITLEEGVTGMHEFEMDPDTREKTLKNPVYISQKVANDCFVINLGLGDLKKKDNYLVSPEGFITIIDFDIMSSKIDDAEIEDLKEKSRKELGISRNEYNKTFEEQERLIALNYARRKDQVDHVLAAYAKVGGVPRCEANAVNRFLNGGKRKKLVDLATITK